MEAIKPQKKKSPKVLAFAFLGVLLVVIIVIIVVLHCLSNSEEREVPKPEVKKKAPPVEVSKPVVKATNKVVQAVEKWTPENDRVMRDKNGRVLYNTNAPVGSKANPIKFGIVNTPGNVVPPRSLYKTFAENYVVGLLRHKPGTRVVGGYLPANFDEQFKAHISDPIVYDPDDTEADREIRRQMQDLKKEIASMIAAGKEPTDIVLDVRKELNRIADYRATAAREINKLRQEGASKEEIDTYIEAANVIMERNGAKKFYPSDYLQKLKLQREQQSGDAR